MTKVYIKGLQMPKECLCCRFLIKVKDEKIKYNLCGLTYELIEKSISKRDKFCPLMEVEE